MSGFTIKDHQFIFFVEAVVNFRRHFVAAKMAKDGHRMRAFHISNDQF